MIFGAYKAPREMNWIVGVLMFGLVLAFSLTGYLLPWDQKGYWATQVATSIIGTSPVIGPALEDIAAGRSLYGNYTLSHFSRCTPTCSAYRRALEVSRAEYERLAGAGLTSAAPYALCLGYRLRFVLDLNAREAMQLIELRSGREGHPSYRAVAHEMHAQIAAVHPAVAGAMTHVDVETEPRLERILSRCAPTRGRRPASARPGREARAHRRGTYRSRRDCLSVTGLAPDGVRTTVSE